MGQKKKTPAEKQPLKKSFLRKNRDLIFVFSIFVPLFYLYILTQPISPFEPREEPFAPYERHYHVGWRFPFITSYFLLQPDNYQPDKYKYPLVLMLHGVSRHMYGGKVLLRPEAREGIPVFAIIPIVPFGFTWAEPKDFNLRPQALPIAIDIMRSVQKKYNVDDHKLFITGYSLGGTGVYGAITRYPGVFAAAVPISAGWPMENANALDPIPTWIFHGALDTGAPPQHSRAIAAQMKKNSAPVQYTEFPHTGHDTWEAVYNDPEMWIWLLNQSRP